MSRYRIAAPARHDLNQVWTYIAEDSPDAADKFLDRLRRRFVQLTEQPRMGRLRPDLGEGVRHVVVGRYLVFYRLVANQVEVLRVLHASRDTPSVFRGGGE